MGKLCVVLACLLLLVCSGQLDASLSVAEAKAAAVGTPVTVNGIVTYVNPTECYIESPNRASGMWVEGNTSQIKVGDKVVASGSLTVVDGEYGVRKATIQVVQGGFMIQPLGIPNRHIGMSQVGWGEGVWDQYWGYNPRTKKYEWLWTPRFGVNTTGLLARTWGKVTASYYSPVDNTKWFFVDDGFGAVADQGDSGVLVYGDADVRPGDVVAVTGISSLERSYDHSARLLRVLRMRDASDVQVVKKWEEPKCPASLEFDTSDSINRVAAMPGGGETSTDIVPGWLTLTPQPTDIRVPSLLRVALPLFGEWDMVTRVRLEWSQDMGPQGVALVLSPNIKATGYPSYPIVQIARMTDKLGRVQETVAVGKDISYGYGQQLTTDTVYLRMRQRRTSLYLAYSLDGAVYSSEYIFSFGQGYLLLFGFFHPTALPAIPFRAHLDYFRYTPVTQ